MKYTLISKTGKVSDLQITLEEALPALRARYGDNGRAILRELLELCTPDVSSIDADPVPMEWLLKQLPREDPSFASWGADLTLPGTICDYCGVYGNSRTLTRQPANPDPEYVDCGGVAPGDRWFCQACNNGEGV